MGARFFRTCPDRPWGPPSLLYNGYRVFSGGKVRLGRDADPSPPSSPMTKNEYSYTSTHPLGHTGPVSGSLDVFTSYNIYCTVCGPGSSIGLATDYGLYGLGSNPGVDEDFPPVQTGPGAHPAPCKMGTGSFPEVKCGRGLLLTTHPLLVPRSWNSRAIPLPTLWATPGL